MESGIYTTCTGNASAWSSSVLEERHAILNPFGHGLHLNRADFDELLRNIVLTNCTSESNNSRFSFEKGKFKGIHRNGKGLWDVEIEDDKGVRKSFVAKWVVDATGRKASVATKLGKKIISPNPLLAFYAVFVASESDSDTSNSDNDMRTIIEATPDGWWYTSLISHKPNNTRIVVFHTLPSHPAAKSSRRSEGFLDRLHDSTTHISSIISKWDYTIQKGYPQCTAAGSSHLETICEAVEKWVAVGDAAMAFDPLSSQGIMTALEMGIYIGLKLSHHLEDEGTDADFDQNVRESYMQVRKDYEKHRTYYYSIVKRFPEEIFWENVCG